MDQKTGRPQLQSERIRVALTDDIASGVLRPGTTLDEQGLAERFGVSRTPVREALRQLSASGEVEATPRRGMTVAQTTPERIRDLFEMTAEVEAMCTRLATYRISPRERSELIDLWESTERDVAQGDLDAYDRANQAFHDTVYKATHNAFMVEQAQAIRARLIGFRRTQLRFEGRLAQSRAEHGEILTHMAYGDGDAAGRAMRAHISTAASALERYISLTRTTDD